MNGWVFNVLVSLSQKKIISCLHNQAVLISPMQDNFDYSVGDGTQLLFRLCQTLLFSYNFFGQKIKMKWSQGLMNGLKYLLFIIIYTE